METACISSLFLWFLCSSSSPSSIGAIDAFRLVTTQVHTWPLSSFCPKGSLCLYHHFSHAVYSFCSIDIIYLLKLYKNLLKIRPWASLLSQDLFFQEIPFFPLSLHSTSLASSLRTRPTHYEHSLCYLNFLLQAF